ncbi:phospholipid-binding protein MlaC [Nitrosomonas sp. Nm132]|jgi:phospholipid transport system substrate-binding protein|uniref:MlaC/ttg2D family ABC transporter substrate-binding protein n=1 Tax=Nitrosomonas sp. Nm132 TaxID=1881053 RepID=UPI00088DFF29|nr:ABC transporter substrate-binding protein [Nitrosomonas sp. Nm132]SDH53786.1 phospholipid transport system substrate-binding protein [Nitrosomonas sp. Nm132]
MKALIQKIILLLASFLLILPLSAKEMAPDQLVKSTVDEVITILKQDDGIKKGNKDRVLDLIETKILPHFNFTRMTRLAMGKNWSKAEPQQQKVLVSEFQTLLVRTYSNALTNYRDEVIEVAPLTSQPDAKSTTVKTRVIQGRGREPVPIEYSMEKTDKGWKVYDVIVAGVSLVTNYRSSFNSEIRKTGVDGLIATLTKKNKSLEGQ